MNKFTEICFGVAVVICSLAIVALTVGMFIDKFA